jgi:diguanylate cyclase (GGDEF)-like protein
MTTSMMRHTDLLTGAWTRDYFEQRLAEAVSSAMRRNKPLSLLRIDIDNLQEHSDLYGRAESNRVLGWLASVVSDVVDGKGPIGRVGDDELAVFLEGLGRDRALKIAEQLRTAVVGTTHVCGKEEYQLTVSVGLAVLRRGEPWGNLVDAAEEACIRAKQAGRDNVVVR